MSEVCDAPCRLVIALLGESLTELSLASCNNKKYVWHVVPFSGHGHEKIGQHLAYHRCIYMIVVALCRFDWVQTRRCSSMFCDGYRAIHVAAVIISMSPLLIPRNWWIKAVYLGDAFQWPVNRHRI